MKSVGSHGAVPFQLQFDKPIASQIKIAEWNPEKDLLALVTEDSKLLLHRFNWQRLWITSTGKCITSICWRPDGKAIAVGLEDGAVSLHDVENGKLLRSMKFHSASIVCLSWEEDREKVAVQNLALSVMWDMSWYGVDLVYCLMNQDGNHNFRYEDRTTRFFPHAPRSPCIPGLVPGDSGSMDEHDDSFQELFDSSHQQFSILCSGDKDGNICFSIFGIFRVGRINIHNLAFDSPVVGNNMKYQLLNASICKVALANDLSHIIILCSGALTGTDIEARDTQKSQKELPGFHCLVLDSAIFSERKNELHQVAQQASNVEHLIEVIRTSLSVMTKQWSDAMRTYHEKFNGLSSLIIDNGLDSTPQEEFLSLLGGARTSPAVHQFLVNTLGEMGLKRVAKLVSGAGKEVQTVVLDHLQPAADIVGFRIGELRGLSKWRARYQGIGLDENLIDNAMEKAGMFLVQVQRFIRVLSSVVQQFSNFFSWLLKSVKILMSEPSDQLLPFNSELIIIFLRFLYDRDPVGQLLEFDHNIEVDLERQLRVRELAIFGGFSDSEFLKRTLASEFQQMEYCFKEALEMPLATVSKRILCKDVLPLFPLESPTSYKSCIPASVSYFQEISHLVMNRRNVHTSLTDYMSFIIPDGTFPNITNCIGICRGIMHDLDILKDNHTPLEAALLRAPDGYGCADISLYREAQLVLLLNEVTSTSESSGNACMMIIQAASLPFVRISRFSSPRSWNFHELQSYSRTVIDLQLENEKVREIPHSVMAPLAVSASRGVACVFAAKKRALVYILEEDEDELTDTDSAYEEGKFCDAFHSSTSGWRCCESCGKTPNPAWPPPSQVGPSQLEKTEDFSWNTSSSFVGSGPVPWRIAPSLFKESNIQSDAHTKIPFEIDVSGGIDLFGTSERLLAGSPEKKQEFSDERCFNGKFRVGPFDALQNGHAALNPKDQPLPSINIQSTILPKNDSSNFSVITASSSKTELDDTSQLSANFSTSQTLSVPVGKQVGTHYRMDGETQVRNGKVLGDSRGRNQLLPRSKSVITPLFEKTLSASDAGRIGRLVLPKKCAEAYFPPIAQPEGVPLEVLDVKGKEWVFQFRFWPNNNSRMYVLEGITPCIQSLKLQAGDVVTFSRLEPGGKLVMGGRKSSSVPSSDQGDGAVIKGSNSLIPESCQAKNKCVEGIPVIGYMKGKSPSFFQPISHVSKADIGSISSEIHETKPPYNSKGNGSILFSKCKRPRTENDIALNLSMDEAQGLIRPAAKIVASVFVVEGCEIEEFEDTAPVIGRPTIPATDAFGKQMQWVQCEDCFKWRKVPQDALLPSEWICSENVWDLDRSRCSDAEELAVGKLQVILPAIKKDSSKRREITTKDAEMFATQERHDTRVNLAIQADDEGISASADSRSNHPSEKSPKHKQSCDCAICSSLKHRFRTLMDKYVKQQLEEVGESISQKLNQQQLPEQVHNVETQAVPDTGNITSTWGEERKIVCLDYHNMQKSSSSPLKGQIDLNIQPEREEDVSPVSESGTGKQLHPHATEKLFMQQMPSGSGIGNLASTRILQDGIGANLLSCLTVDGGIQEN
ncbi:hypothetical protein F511_08593 [Dorcoceras hygrometricum]|uniref:Anaphase-promoting complex subunit 4 n=1 Tax=Dorcoceras hygrometricum TaxID=472368 RepID=A0A2Z7CYT9_9LAMI|nr:hypothetical protein F511_08593 [Dorcoceras hygrometricum]